MSDAAPDAAAFYDELTPLYHLIFADWDASMRRQGEQLSALIRQHDPTHRSVLDVSCGIGTQALALATHGYHVTASDLSPREVERARREAALRGLSIDFSVCDMRHADTHHRGGFDVVISCDNSIPHLLDDAQITAALRAMHRSLRAGGCCLISVRDYDDEPRGTGIVKPYGVRFDDGKRYMALQVWDFDGDLYDLTLYLIEEDLRSRAVTTHTMRARYYAIGSARLLSLMRDAGFASVQRIDGAFYQPVLIGTRRT